MTVALTIPDVITLREGQSRDIGIVFRDLYNHSISWQYVAGPLGGTAGTGDISGVSGAGSMSIWAIPAVTRTTWFNLGALRDDQTEGTETAYIQVSVSGMPFDDGSYSRLVEVRILDDNMIDGTAGNDVLRGTSRAETLTGAAGNDQYHVTAGDVVVEAADSGNDTINSAISWRLGGNIENLILTGSAAINGIGNGLDNRITGNAGANILDGGAGRDTLVGGRGDDRYLADADDTVIEAANGGIDTLVAGFSLTLGAHVENLALTGTAALDGTGNELDNRIAGNAGANTLDGGAGADTLGGGAGDDIYVVDNAGDRVVEVAGQGVDLVRASVSHALAAQVEQLTLTGSAAINGTGNALDNRIIGNDRANTLDGGAGADTLGGGADNDIYVVDNAGDRVVEVAGQGVDLVRASVSHALAAQVEQLTLTGSAAINGTGNALDNRIIGNGGDNALAGGAGADTLSGGTGNDRLYGGAGEDRLVGGAGTDVLSGGAEAAQRDVFVFQNIADSATGIGRDRLQDFQHGTDLIDLGAIDANTRLAGNQGFAFSGTTAAANSVWYAQSGANLVVRVDHDGDSLADFELLIGNQSSLTAADFLL